MSTTEPTRGTHPVVIGHLVMGLAFLGLVGIWAAVEYGGVSTEDLRWLLPLPWVFAGATGLLAVTLSGRRRTAAPYAAATTEPPYAEHEFDTDHTTGPDDTVTDLDHEEEQR
ncbi:MAG: hypothetical protein QM714_18380 [Nocardioides sp.]|uniref:hypothetical protein n=1 Tax=Nocardioides sp. TaxID=35761 RepID=UPI0039E65D12